MMLRTGGDVRFKLRPVEGAMPLADVQPERLILDGQQRLTSLFQSLASGKPVQTQDIRKHPVSGWFYMDIRMALDPYADREDAILFLPADRMQRNFRSEITAVRSPRVAVLAIIGMLNSATEWFSPNGDLTAEEIGHILADNALTGLIIR